MNEPPSAVTYGSTETHVEDEMQGYLSENEQRALAMRMEISRAFDLLRRKYVAHITFYSCIAVVCGCTPTALFMFLQFEWFANWYMNCSSWVHVLVNTSNSIMFYILVASGFRLDRMFDIVRINHVLGNFVVCLNSGVLIAMASIDMVAVYLNVGKDTNGGTDGRGMSPDSWVFMLLTIITLLASLMATLNTLHLIYYEGVYMRITEDLLLNRSTAEDI